MRLRLLVCLPVAGLITFLVFVSAASLVSALERSVVSEERLDEIVRMHEDAGAMIFNPHRYTLEEGGRQTVDDRQLRFKKEADPKGLLNPGKMISWDDPDWSYEKMYAFPGLKAKD